MVLPMVTMAQLSPSGQVKVITPNVLSACARDTIWLELTNNDGPTCNTGAGPVQTVQFDITHPGTGQIFYQPASVGSETNIASEVSYTGNTLSMTMEVPSLDNTNRAYFVLNATCDVTDVSTLPQLDITANYPTAFPVATESFKSVKMNIGVGEITFTHASSSYINTVRTFNQTINHAQYITNTGFGRITELTYHQIVHDSLTGSIQNKDWAYIRRVSPSVLSPFSLGMDAYPDYQMTNLGNGYRYISFTIKGAQLDREDGQFDPGDRIQINASYLRAPSTCIAPMNQTQWVTYNCVGSGTACAEPDSLVKTFRISAGTPVVAAVNSTVEAWDGCPEKAASFTFKNTGAASSSNPEVGTAYDVDLGLTFNGNCRLQIW